MLQCYDEDSGKDDLIGSVAIDLNQLYQRGSRDEWFPLQTTGGKPAGEIRLVLQFQPQGGVPAGAPPGYGAPPPQAAYGAPPPGYGAPPPQGAYGAPPGYGAPPPHGAYPPPQAAYGMPPPGYGAPAGYPPAGYPPQYPPGAAGYGAVRPVAYGVQVQAGYAGAYPAIPGAIGVMRVGKFKHGKMKMKGAFTCLLYSCNDL